ncbi:hypothetical protein C5167_043040 [Papaver somniferum]|uniref:Uncharacterized protein n=1 Tax=Papaver somniferum TaxID=3469 RepID=A0A4Y7L773_PAPSO|nr:hypothetical protein C5167_043040 [Papaver somniferum]
MCYIGKATKIFICVITILFAGGIVLTISLVKRHHDHKSYNCYGEDCQQPAPSLPSTGFPPNAYSPPTPSAILRSPIRAPPPPQNKPSEPGQPNPPSDLSPPSEPSQPTPPSDQISPPSEPSQSNPPPPSDPISPPSPPSETIQPPPPNQTISENPLPVVQAPVQSPPSPVTVTQGPVPNPPSQDTVIQGPIPA